MHIDENENYSRIPHGRSRKRPEGLAANEAAAVTGTSNAPASAAGSSERKAAAETPAAIPAGSSRARVHEEKPRGNKVLLRRAVIFSILEVITVIGILVFAYASKQYAKIQRPEVRVEQIQNENLTKEEIEEIEKGYWNIAVFGVDSRDSSVGRGANSDVIMVVSINRETGGIQLVSVFRDTFLKTGNSTYSKINSAYCEGGPEQALKELNENLDLNITQYVTFNWKAVVTGINILGGVDLELSKAEFNGINGYITETVNSTGIGSTQLTHAGMQHLDGVQAVAYARLRYMDNDYARTERQRKVIQECFNKAKQTDVSTLTSMIGVMLELVATNMTWQDGIDALGNITKYNITETAGFPFARGEANMGKHGACVIPQTLESNVRDLHTMLFPDMEYEPSEQLKQISANISAKTGMYKEGTNVGHVSTEGWMPSSNPQAKSGSGEVGENQQESGESTEKESQKKKNDDLEYSISNDGYLIYVDSVDENGNKKYKYMLDANGKRIKMIDYDADGNMIYLYEIDEDGNFFFDSEIGDESQTEKEKETDEDGNVLPGQDDDDDIMSYGPGGMPMSTEAATEKETNGGPGVQNESESIKAVDKPGSQNGEQTNENLTEKATEKTTEESTDAPEAEGPQQIEDDNTAAGPGAVISEGAPSE